VQSPNYPENYGVDEACLFHVRRCEEIIIMDFSTEAEWDILRINEVDYSGDVSPTTIVPSGQISWSSDFADSKHGWRMCVMEEIANCTVTNGSAISSSYPCLCGLATCDPGDICISTTSTCCGRDLIIESQQALLDFAKLPIGPCTAQKRNVEIKNTAGFTSLNGLESLMHVEGDLIITDNDGLTSLSGLDALMHIDGKLELKRNDRLTSLTGLGKLRRVGDSIIDGIAIEHNAALTALIGLESLTFVRGSVFITGNANLTSLRGVDNLMRVAKDFVISSNDGLTSLTGLGSLTSVQWRLIINGNTQLTSLRGLDKLLRVWDEIRVYGNNRLRALGGLDQLAPGAVQHINFDEVPTCTAQMEHEALTTLSFYADDGGDIPSATSERWQANGCGPSEAYCLRGRPCHVKLAGSQARIGDMITISGGICGPCDYAQGLAVGAVVDADMSINLGQQLSNMPPGNYSLCLCDPSRVGPVLFVLTLTGPHDLDEWCFRGSDCSFRLTGESLPLESLVQVMPDCAVPASIPRALEAGGRATSFNGSGTYHFHNQLEMASVYPGKYRLCWEVPCDGSNSCGYFHIGNFTLPGPFPTDEKAVVLGSSLIVHNVGIGVSIGDAMRLLPQCGLPDKSSRIIQANSSNEFRFELVEIIGIPVGAHRKCWCSRLDSNVGCDKVEQFATDFGLVVILCPPGSSDGDGDGSCQTCRNGTVKEAAEGSCLPCAAGRYAATPEGPCNPCDAGKYANEGQAECSACESGTTLSEDQTQCAPCPKGTYRSSNMADCQYCPSGTFSNLTALTACEHCEESFTTLTPGSKLLTDCVCPQGTYFGHSPFEASGGKCTKCESMLLCPGGFNRAEPFDSTLNVTSGYMIMEQEGKPAVFRCARQQACPGARQVFSEKGVMDEEGICQGNFIFGPGCSHCKGGYYENKGSCMACNGAMASPWTANVFTVMYAMAGCVLLFHKSMYPPEPITMAWGTIVAFLQAIIVANQLSFVIPEIIITFVIEPLGFIQLDFHTIGLSLDCTAGAPFMQRFASKLLWPLYLVVGFACFFIFTIQFRWMLQLVLGREIASPVDFVPQSGPIKRLFDKAESSTKASMSGIPLSKRLLWYWPVNILDLINAMMKTQSGLFIILTNTALTIFRFNQHPSGLRTVHAFPDVLEGSNNWYHALPLSIIEIAIVTVGFFSFVLYLVIVAPFRVSNDPKFRRKFRCLWAKFDPGAWWFCLVHLVYALSLNLVPVLSRSARLQILSIVFVIYFYILILCHIKPWKFALNHWADLATKLGYACFVGLAICFDVGVAEDPYVLGPVLLLPIIVPLLFVLGKMLWFVWYHRVAKVHELGARAEFAGRMNDVIKIVASRDMLELRAYAINLLDNDARCVDRALDALLFTLLGYQSKHWQRWRVAPIPFKVASKVRLAAEMQARGLVDNTDVRIQMRQFRNALDTGHAASTELNSVRAWAESSQSSMGRVSAHVHGLVATYDEDGDGLLSKAEFISGMSRHFASHPELRDVGDDFFATIFDYIDIDKSGAVTAIEVANALHKEPEPDEDMIAEINGMLNER